MQRLFGGRRGAARLAARAFTALAVCICFSATTVAAQDFPYLVRTEASKRLVEDGRNSLLEFRIAEGEATFRDLLRRPDGAVAAYHHLAAASLLKAVMTDEPAYYAEFYGRADSMQHALKSAPGGKWRTYLDAENHLQRMVVHAKEENHIRAALAARVAYIRSAQAIRRYPDFYEPYKGMGLLHLAIGSLPRTYRSLLSLLGFPGEVEQGLRELRIAAEKSTYSRQEGWLGLALTDALLYSEPEKGEPVLQKLHLRRPNSPLLAFFYGFILLKNRKASAAERVLLAASEREGKDGYARIHYIDYFVADALFRQSRFAEAERYYRRYLSRHEGPALRAPSYLALGLALEMQGKRDEALRYYERVQSGRSYDDDAVAIRHAKERLTRPMTPVERRLLLGANAFDAGNYDQAEVRLNDVWTAANATSDERAEAAYRLGRLYQVQERWNEALRSYTACIEQPQDPMARWAPWSRYHMGQIYAEQGNTNLASASYRAALAYEGKFDYYQSLEQSAKAALKRLN